MPSPPVAKKVPHPVVLHGDTLEDDYYWLREKGAPDVEAYLRDELAYARAFMQPTEALQKRLYDEMLSRIQQTDESVPYRDRGFFYYARTEEGKQYAIQCRRPGSLSGAEEVILDLNELAEGKAFIQLGDMTVSPDGHLLAYTTDETGFRQFTLRVKDLRTGEMRPDVRERVTSMEWAEDGRSLLYAIEHPQTKRSYQIFRHRLGESEDALVYEDADERFDVWVSKSRDRKLLFVQSGSHTTSEVRYLPADRPETTPILVAPRRQDHEYAVDHRDGLFWIRTNDRGRHFRLVTAPVGDPRPETWTEVVAHRDDVMLAGLLVFQDFYVLFEREGGLPHLRVTDFRRGESHRIAFPEQAYLALPSENREFATETFRLAYQSPVTPPSIYDYDPVTRERTLRKQVAVLGGYDAAQYHVELTHATAADGVRVPLWMVYRKDRMKKDGRQPALLYAYGAYGIANSAAFNPNVFSLVDRGVTYAMAYIRGGGELGKTWHDQGRMENKRNTFTDFIAAGEHLVREGYTSPSRLAIQGGSAGGLLMGAVANLRPDLFAIVMSHVPFVDVVNTMLDESLPLTVPEFEEWGNPKIEAQYRYIRSYSPYDNLEAKAYPTILVKTSFDDSQVMYWEPAKYVAKLRTLKTDANPLLLKIKLDPAGHGGASGRYDALHEVAFDYAWILGTLGVTEAKPTP
jgi:oligopeptidase B